MFAKLTPIALWKRFFSAYHSAWFERARARAATNPRYAEIDQLRREAAAADPYPDPDALPILSVDTLFEQLDILSDLNPPTWAHRFDAWLDAHPGVAHPFRTLAAFWHRGRHG